MKKQAIQTGGYNRFYTLKRAFIKSLPFGGLFTVLFGGVFGYSFYNHIAWIERLQEEAAQNPQEMGQFKDLMQNYRYFFSDSEGFIQYFLLITSALVALLLGITLFRFIAGKKTVNVYYSLGISRLAFFLQRMAGGFFAILIGVSLPILTLAALNITAFGNSRELWITAFYLTGAYCSVSAIAFTLSAAVFSTVGTVAEGASFTAIILAFPSLVFTALEPLFNKFIFGSPFTNAYFVAHPTENFNYSELRLIERLSIYNPILYPTQNLMRMASLTRENTQEAFAYTAPDFLPVVLWSVFVLALLGLGALLFRRRRAELCGFFGMSRVGNFLCAALLGISAFSLCVAYLPLQSTVLCALCAFAAYFLLYVLVDTGLHRSRKSFLKGLYTRLPAHFALALVLLLVLQGGLFGYSARVPELDEIKSVAITPVSITPFISSSYFGDSNRAYQYYQPVRERSDSLQQLEFYVSQSNTLYHGFDKPEQIQAVYELHKKIAETGKLTANDPMPGLDPQKDGVACDVVIRYSLRDGSEFARTFSVTTPALLEELATLQQNLFWAQENASYRFEMPEAGEAYLHLVSPHMDAIYENKLNAQQLDTLSKAIRQDFAAQDAKQVLFPDKPPLGFLVIDLNHDFPTWEWTNRGNAYKVLDLYNNNDYYCTTIPYYTHNTAALDWLAANNIEQNPENAGSYISATVYPADFPSSESPLTVYHSGNLLQFIGLYQEANSGVSNGYGLKTFSGNGYAVTNSETLAELEKISFPTYYNSRGGYYVQFRSQNGGYTTCFIPMEKMPAALAAAVAERAAQQK